MTIRNLTNRLLEVLHLRKIPELDDAGWQIPEVWHGKSEHELELEATEA
jgi:hypothetical protein